jgi:hypothetical protein
MSALHVYRERHAPHPPLRGILSRREKVEIG